MKLLIPKWGLQSSNSGFRKNKPLLVGYEIWDAIDTETALCCVCKDNHISSHISLQR